MGLENNNVSEVESKVNIMLRRDKYNSCVSVCRICPPPTTLIGSDSPFACVVVFLLVKWLLLDLLPVGVGTAVIDLLSLLFLDLVKPIIAQGKQEVLDATIR